MKLFFFFVFISSVSAVCKRDFEETICENFTFVPELFLDSGTNKLIIKNAAGPIIHENFANLDQVKEIIIRESKITSVEVGSLCCTPNLTSITLVNSEFPTITKSVLQGCQNLKKLYVDGRIEIENGAFSRAENLQSLSINASRIPVLRKEMLKGLVALKSLSITHSGLETIEGAFQYVRNLKLVDLQNNKIRGVGDSFKGLSDLKVLNLGDNKLRDLSWQEFDGLKALRVLFLERNDFDSVNVDKLVAGVPDLERIFFSYDRLNEESRKKIEETLPKFNITFIYIAKPLN